MLRAPAGCQNKSPQRREGLFQKWIIDISTIVAAIERAAIGYVERRTTTSKTEWQVRIRDEQLAEGNEVCASVRDHLHCAAVVVISVHDIGTIPQITQTTNIESGPRFWCAILFNDVQVSQVKASEFGHKRAERLARVGVKHGVESVQRRDSNADPICPPDIGDGLRYLKKQPDSVRHRSTVPICSLVGTVPQELIE